MTAAEDWIEDMSGVSATAFRAAVQNWRRGPNAFKPSPGQLLASIERIEAPLRERLESAEAVCAAAETVSVHDRLNQLHQWLYELDLGFVPFELVSASDVAQRDYIASETARIKAEIKQLEKQEI